LRAIASAGRTARAHGVRPRRPASAALATSLDAFLAWIEENPEAYANLMRSANSPEIRDMIEGVRSETVGRVLEGCSCRRRAAEGPYRGHGMAVVHGRRVPGLGRQQGPRALDVHGILLGTLMGALASAGFAFPQG
jgi:hypothetical protein